MLKIAVSRMHLLKVLFISCLIGFMASNVNGDCSRPVFTDPYGILITPDQDNYTTDAWVSFSCASEHEGSGLRSYSVCQPDGTWANDDPTDSLCLKAQCEVSGQVDSDLNVTTSATGGSHNTIVDNNDKVFFSCATPGQTKGVESGSCYNGTIEFEGAPPQCLAYCPFVAGDLGPGVSYSIPDDPADNDTNTLYYSDADTVRFICDEGYNNLNCTAQTCVSICRDGIWDPEEFPMCSASVTPGSPDSTTSIDSSTGSPGIITEATVTPINPDTTTSIDSSTASPGTTTEAAPANSSLTVTDEATSLPGTTETEPVRSTSAGEVTTPVTEPSKTEPKTEPEKTTASPTSKPTTPEKTEKPPTTPLPCGGECLATQVCNADDECECRPDYYLDEEDTCKEPTSIDVSIRITYINDTAAEYIKAYGDPTTPEFKALEEDVCEPFDEIYTIEAEYRGCRVLEFTNGSIIVDYVLRFVEGSTKNASSVNQTIHEEVQNTNGSFSEFGIDESSIAAVPLDECKKKTTNDCGPNAACTDKGDKGYECACEEGFVDIGVPTLLPGRECLIIEATDPPTTTERPETGPEVWKVVVGVTVPIIGVLTITVISLMCWQYRRLDRTAPVSGSIKMKTYPYDTDSDREARPESVRIMNNNGTVQEVVLPWRDLPAEGEFIFAADSDKGRSSTQMLPKVDYPTEYRPAASYEDPLDNIVSSYDNYTYQHHETGNTTELDAKYF